MSGPVLRRPSDGTSPAGWERFEIAPGVDLYVHATPKFKTVTMKAYLHRPLGPHATGLALLPALLRRGCRGAVNMRRMVQFLEDLYGASMGADVAKIGERHVLAFGVEVVNDRFAPKRCGTLRRGLRFLSDLLLRPVLRRGVFPADPVAQEQENLRRLIEGRINDRASYAYERCVEEMCRDEPYGTYEYGRVEEIGKYGPRELKDLHEEVTARAPVHLFVLGDVKPNLVADLAVERFRFRRRSVDPLPPVVTKPAPSAPRETVERMEVEQGNLVLGYRGGATWSDPGIFAMSVCNGVLGGFPHSKLFRNVREGAGLAYSVSSWLEKTKGLLFLAAGIDCGKLREALANLRRELDDIREGTITDEEMEKTLRSLVDRVRSRDDSPASTIHFFEELLVGGRTLTSAQVVAGLERVTKKEIAAAARAISEDTVFFLTR